MLPVDVTGTFEFQLTAHYCSSGKRTPHVAVVAVVAIVKKVNILIASQMQFCFRLVIVEGNSFELSAE